MRKGTIFSHDGRQYEVLVDGVEKGKKGAKACIRPPDETRGISIDKAIQKGLIQATSSTTYGGDELADTGLELFANRNATTTRAEICFRERPDSNPTEVERSTRARNDVSVLYLPVDALRAQLFLAHGLIYPSIYDQASGADLFNDLQSQFPGDLTLVSEVPAVAEKQLVLAVMLTRDELADAVSAQATTHLQVPLPISRLSKILVPIAKANLPTYIKGWIKPDVPVPEHLFEALGPQQRPARSAREQDTNRKHEPKTSELAESIDRFNKLLGVFAFLRNAHRYLSKTTGVYADYPEAFFSLAGKLFRDHLQRERQWPAATPLGISLLNTETAPTGPLASLLQAVNSPDQFIEKQNARSVAMEIYAASANREHIGQAFKKLFDGDYLTAVSMLKGKDVPREALLLSGLFKFSNRLSNDHRNVKQGIETEWSDPNVICDFLAMLGFYYGYTALDATESIVDKLDPILVPIVEPRAAIKFNLANRFERRLIEAVYQWVFFRRQFDNELEALYADAPIKEAPQRALPRSGLIEDDSFAVAGMLIRCYKKTSSAGILQRIRAMPVQMIDSRSEVGRYLFRDCFDIAEEAETIRKNGKVNRYYRISKERLCSLVAEARIEVNAAVLGACIDEDAKERRK